VIDLERSLARIAADLRALGVRFALVGGLAVAVRAEPRLTRDADLAVSVATDAEAESVVLGLQQRGHRVLAAVEQKAVGRLSTVRLTQASGDSGVVTDLLFASSGIETEIVGRASVVEVLPSLSLPVASVGDLIAMKLLARDDRRRPADADDLRALATTATDDDWTLAEAAVHLIESRGFQRGRDLAQSLRDLRAELG
jgi:predicted nucleotidyltransferase